jgi:hypothetical protein
MAPDTAARRIGRAPQAGEPIAASLLLASSVARGACSISPSGRIAM